MVIPTGLEDLNGLLKGGYPERSSILIVGPPGIGKEAIGYWFIHSGLSYSDFCLYVTRLAVSEVLQDMRAFHIDVGNPPMWIASEGAQINCDITDLASMSVNIKEALRRGGEGSIRIVTDILSPLLMLNPSETIYRFLSQLLTDVKRHKAVFLATIEEGMHQPQVLAAMEQLFDGVPELKLFEEGLRVVPLLRIRKMRGIPPEPGYFRFSFSSSSSVFFHSVHNPTLIIWTISLALFRLLTSRPLFEIYLVLACCCPRNPTSSLPSIAS